MSEFGITEENVEVEGNGKQVSRIRALLAIANHEGTSDHEREAARAKAEALAAKYGVDMARADDEDIDIKEYEVTRSPFADQAASLIYWVAEAIGCRAIIVPGVGVTVIGYTADVRRGDVLSTALGLAMNSQASRVAGPDSVVRGWMEGFIREAARRLREAEKRARERADQDMLAERKAKLDEIFSQEFPFVTKGRAGMTGGGYWDGAAAGRTADIGQDRMGGQRTGIGG